MSENKFREEKFGCRNSDDYPSIKIDIELPKPTLNEKLLLNNPNLEELKDKIDSSSVSDEKQNENGVEGSRDDNDTNVRDNILNTISNTGNNQKAAGFNKFVTNFVASPFDDTEEEEDDEDIEEEEDTKVKFNHKVSELAQFYINEDEISSFYFSQFLETVIIHLIYFVFGPLSIPILFLLFGRNFIINIGFYGKKVGASHIIQIFYWSTFVTTTVFTILILNSEKTSIFYNQYVFLCPAYVSQTMVLIRYIIVCVKYGFFPPDYYKKLKNSRLTRTELKSNFLLQGWIKPSLLVLDVYLKEIFQKYNIDVNKFKFQCIGSLSNSLEEDFKKVDRIINEEVKRIRQSVFRRFKKQDKFYGMIKDIIARYKIKEKIKSVKSQEKIMIKDRLIEIELPQITEVNNEYDEYNENEINEDKMDQDESNRRLSHKKPQIKLSPAIKKFRIFYFNKLLPEVRKNLNNQSITLEDKVKYKNEYVYEIKGFYLCRAILKNVFTVDFVTYSSLHKILVTLLVLVPFIFTFLYYYFFNDFIKMLKDTTENACSNPSTSSPTVLATSTSNTESQQVKFTMNYMSIIFLIFSFFSIIPPTWLNTINLIYGVIDIRRRKRLMEITTEVFNTNIKFEKRIYPLFNILNGPTLLNWYSLRTIFMSYGKRFGDRILFQTSIYCVFVILSILCSFLSLFGIFKPFISMCLGISFIFSIFINFAVIFLMFLAGAELNYFEYHHLDLLSMHKLFLDGLNNYPKLFKMNSNSYANSFSNYKLSFLGDTNLNEEKERKDSDRNNRPSHYNASNNIKRSPTSGNANIIEEDVMIYNNKNSDIFIKSILCDENMLKLIEKNDYFLRLTRILENIRGKLMIDSIVRPLRIFWVKADYKIVGNIVAVFGTGIGLIMSILFKGINLSDILST